MRTMNLGMAHKNVLELMVSAAEQAVSPQFLLSKRGRN